MDRPIARPARPQSADTSIVTPSGVPAEMSAASPHQRRKPRPGWTATIVRSQSFAQLRRIQKSTTDPVIDLSYLADACVELALELGAEEIVKRAVASFGTARSTT
ncbi:MAG: hypothetical protein K2Y02_10690 [Burkholderiaceae bacterium]|jgi:hypothetical protein|nr:hypothetical protein [Burkholderiaceae bacterium]